MSSLNILKPKSKQYIEFNWDYYNGSDCQIRFYSTSGYFFFYKDSRNYHTGTYCSWYGKGDQTGEWGVSRPSFPTIIGIGIDYDNCKVSWYVNGNLKYDKTLSSWSYNRDSDSNIYKYTSIYYDESYISSLNIYREDIKYLPEEYNSFADVNYQYKIFDMKDNYGLK